MHLHLRFPFHSAWEKKNGKTEILDSLWKKGRKNLHRKCSAVDVTGRIVTGELGGRLLLKWRDQRVRKEMFKLKICTSFAFFLRC